MPFSLFKDLLDTFRQPSEPTNGTPPVMAAPPMIMPSVHLMGIVKRGGSLLLTAPDARVRGVKLVSVTGDFLERYDDVVTRYTMLQVELNTLPKALRPRQRKPRAARDVEPGE